MLKQAAGMRDVYRQKSLAVPGMHREAWCVVALYRVLIVALTCVSYLRFRPRLSFESSVRDFRSE